MINSEIFKYFRTLNDFIPSGEILVDTFGNTDVFISVTTNTFYIFDLNKFDILFTGPYIPGITHYVFHKDILFISTGKSLGMYQRSSKIGNFDYKEEINQVMCIGELVFTLHKNKIEIRRIKEDGNDDEREGGNNDHNVNNDKDFNDITDINNDITDLINNVNIPFLNISFFYHPMTYLNKILLISDSQTSLYNFIKKKEIYKFKSFKKGVCIVRDTKVVDLVGVGYTNGQIDIINLKKDQILFSFNLKNEIKDLDFSNEKMSAVGGGDLYIFDLIEKRLILKTRAVSGKFIGEDYVLMSKSERRDDDGSRDNDNDYGDDIKDNKSNAQDNIHDNININSLIGLFKIHNNSLNLIKVKNNLRSEILFLEEGNLDNTFVVVSKGEVFKYNTGNTLNYQKLKFKGKIEKMSFKGGEGVLYGDKILYKLGNSIKFILNSEIDLITNYKEISGILVDSFLIILNLNTKMIYKKIPVNEPIKFIKMDRMNLYVMYEKRIKVVPYWKGGRDNGGSEDYKGSMDIDLTPLTNTQIYTPLNNTPIFNTPTFDSFKVFDSLIVLSSTTGLFLFSNGLLFRTFPGFFKDFTISPNLKWLGVCKGDFILIFDILTGTQIDSIPLKGKFIRFTLDMMFILIVTDDNKIILLNNKSKFSPLKRREEKTISKIKKEDFLKIKKKNQKLTGEILLEKTLKEIYFKNNLIDNNNTLIMNNNTPINHPPIIINNLLDFTIFLNKILKNKKIKKEEAEKIEEKYEEIFKKFEENFIKSVGYLEIEREF